MRTLSLILLTVTACQLSTKNEFQGSWYRCDYLGQYSEIHISESELIYNWTFPNGWYSPYKYEVVNDTLVFIDTLHNWLDEQGNPAVIKSQLILTENELEYLRGTPDSVYYPWTFTKIPYELDEYHNNDSISRDKWLSNQFYERARFFNCQDQRTDEERTLDSLEQQRMLEDLGDIF